MAFAPHLLSMVVGMLSLGQEILWVRAVSFAQHGTPQAFAFVLATYLVGIALGAHAGKVLTLRSKDLWATSGVVLLLSAAYDLASPWMLGMSQHYGGLQLGGAIVIAMSSALKAIIFPIAHHLGTDASGPRVGRSLSRVYVANIIGCTLGPVVFGFWLLDRLSTQQCFALVALGTLLAGACCLLRGRNVVHLTGAIAVGLVAVALFNAPEQLIRTITGDSREIKAVAETRQGIITVYPGGDQGDLVYGGNAYDGRTNLDPVINSNGIHRLLMLSVLKENPERVAMVGLSIGTWLKLVTAFPGVKQIDVIEINPGYLKAMEAYPAQASALMDPRVTLHIDDGRRWLRTRPEASYDLVIMNTTFYWRAYASNLLSRDFLADLRRHMRPGAVLAYNSTGSPDAFNTAAAVFPHAYLYENFIVASDFDFRPLLDTPRGRTRLKSLELDGKPMFPAASEATIERVVRTPFVTVETVAARTGRPLGVITDRNLLSEYRYGL
jgi:spermidine synthase